MKYLRKTNIVCTIGPASESEEIFTQLVKAGLNVARINFSHGGYEENAEKIATIKRVREKLHKPVALLLDTKGPEIRTGKLESGDQKVELQEGDTFTFVCEEIIGNHTRASVSYENLYQDVTPGATILVDDGAIEFEVKEVKGKEIICKILNNGKLGSRKTINVPGLKLNFPALSQKDIDDITNGVKAGFDMIAASFIRRKSDVEEIRALLKKHHGEEIQIISKIESQEGIDNFEEILEASDGIMVARGDMGVEIPMEQVPVVQKHFIKRCNEVGKPVITATQMLESMTTNPRATRAEVSDVANAVYDRTGSVMLSGECAMGKYPVECVRTMHKIAITVEPTINYWKRFSRKDFKLKPDDLEGNIAYVTCMNARNIEARAIIAYTRTGNSARRIASMGPSCPIIAITSNEKTYYQLGAAWNVDPVLIKGEETIEKAIEKAILQLREEGILEKGDRIIISGGSKILPDSTSENKVIGGALKI